MIRDLGFKLATDPEATQDEMITYVKAVNELCDLADAQSMLSTAMDRSNAQLDRIFQYRKELADQLKEGGS